jgi:hypothetical protein
MKLILTPGLEVTVDDGGPGIRATPDLAGRKVLDDELMTLEHAGTVEFRGLAEMELDAVATVDINEDQRAFVSSLTFHPRADRPISGLAVRGCSVPDLLRVALEALTFPAVKVVDSEEWVAYVDKTAMPARTMPTPPRRPYRKVTDEALGAFVADYLEGGYALARERCELSPPTARKWKEYAVKRGLLPSPSPSAGGRPTHRD